MTDEQQAAFLIDGVAYPVPSAFRLADPVLVKDVTGLEWPEFEARYTTTREAVSRGEKAGDAIIVLGLIAVAVWQMNPSWKRERVARFVEQVDFESLDSQGPVAAAEEPTKLPPEVGGARESQNGSASSTEDDSDLVTTQLVPGVL